MASSTTSGNENWETFIRLLGSNSTYLPLQPSSATPKQSSAIRVTSLEISLLLPVVLRLPRPVADPKHGHESQPKMEAVETVVQYMKNHSDWQEVVRPDQSAFPSNPLNTQGQISDEAWEAMQDYSEELYFHSFARNFQYPSRDDVRHANLHKTPIVNRNLRILERSDLQTVEFDWTNGQQTQSMKLDCRRCRLFVYDVGVAVLELSLGLPEGGQPSLQETLCALDYLRRIYAPYFISSDDGLKAGRSLDSLTFTYKDKSKSSGKFGRAKFIDGVRFGEHALKDVAKQIDKLATDREPFLAEPWADLLYPLQSKGLTVHSDVRMPAPEEPQDKTIEFQLVLDERLQLMTFMQVDDVNAISPGDWIRIANADDSGDSFCYPYSPAFIEAGDFASMHYGRYWDQSQRPEVAQWLCRTRWLCSGYHLAVVGDRNNWFFNEPKASLRTQFGRHYFKLYLIAQMQLATLLSFKQRISNALDDLRSRPATSNHGRSHHAGQDRFAAEILAIENDFLYFRNTYWIPDVSNQIQAQELFMIITRHLGTQKWFDSIRDEIKDASSLIQTRDMVRSIRTIEHMQSNVEWVELFIIGVYAVELPYAFSHIWHVDNGFFRLMASLMVLITVGLIANLTRPWAIEKHDNRRRDLVLGLAIGWIIILACSVLAQPAKKAEPGDSANNRPAANDHP